jgi:hypothetical protein
MPTRASRGMRQVPGARNHSAAGSRPHSVMYSPPASFCASSGTPLHPAIRRCTPSRMLARKPANSAASPLHAEAGGCKAWSGSALQSCCAAALIWLGGGGEGQLSPSSAEGGLGPAGEKQRPPTRRPPHSTLCRNSSGQALANRKATPPPLWRSVPHSPCWLPPADMWTMQDCLAGQCLPAAWQHLCRSKYAINMATAPSAHQNGVGVPLQRRSLLEVGFPLRLAHTWVKRRRQAPTLDAATQPGA